MISLRSILWLVLGGLLAVVRPACGQTVTGAVVNAWGSPLTNTPVTFTPWPTQTPRALTGGRVATGTAVSARTDAGGAFSVQPVPGFYTVQIGALATKSFLIEVGTNSGAFDWTELITTNSGLAVATNSAPFQLQRLLDIRLRPPTNGEPLTLYWSSAGGYWTNGIDIPIPVYITWDSTTAAGYDSTSGWTFDQSR